jgi:hypothetical protein
VATVVAVGISALAVTMLRHVGSGASQETDREAVGSSEVLERVAAVE